ncbi:MAG: outer membrane lipid asymmetry maintenance protein MlaD [Marivivens sp.]|jgi:phospholipid/cholesterol/gamma-HCH transport system substrate-binding protein|nr:outer membrane lipid asymmetry maintenance protein MlaD [Marivivens sp.]
MRENIVETLVGTAVVVVAAAFLVFTLQTTGGGGSTSGYSLNAAFRSAEGVSVGTDVRLAGVKIGTVTDMVLDAQTFRAVTVMDISADVPIPDDSTAVVASEGLLGGTFVEIVPGGSFDNYADGAQILDTQGAVSLTSLLLRFVSGGGEGE